MKDYDVIYPPKGRVTFDGGKNSKFERSIIADNESPDCYNVIFSNGAAETRQGTTKLNTAPIGTYAVDGLYTRHDNTGAQTMVAFCKGSAWQWTGSTFTTIASGQSVFTAGVRVAATEYENHMFIGNGGVTPYKYNGAHFTRHGVPPATGAVSAASYDSGSLTGDQQFKVTYVNSASVEGDVGTATVTINVTSATVRLTGIPTAPQSHGVSSRRIYRLDSGTYKRVATISDNTTTTLDVDGTETLGAAAPTDQGEPPKYSVIVQHQNRLFMNDTANPNYMWYTEALEPYTVKTTNFQPIGDASQDIVRGAAVYDNGIIVTGDRSFYLWYMPSTDPTDWSVIKLRSAYGSKSPFGMFLYNNKLMVPAMENTKFVGFAAISGATIDPEATELEQARAGSELKSERVEDDMFEVQEAYVGNISAMVFKNKAYITVTSGSGETTNNRLYIFDFSISNLKKRQEASWVPVTGINASQFTVYDGTLYYGSSEADGFVYEIENGLYSDDGTAINSYYWTKEFSGNPGHENFQKDFRRVKLLVEKSGAFMMNLTYRVDSDKGDGITKQVSLDPGSMLWGTGQWGRDAWGGGTDQEEVDITLGQVTGKRIQFRFSNQNAANQRFKVHGLNFWYNIKGKR